MYCMAHTPPGQVARLLSHPILDMYSLQATSIVEELRKKLRQEVAIINTPPFLDVRA